MFNLTINRTKYKSILHNLNIIKLIEIQTQFHYIAINYDQKTRRSNWKPLFSKIQISIRQKMSFSPVSGALKNYGPLFSITFIRTIPIFRKNGDITTTGKIGF